MGGSREKDSTRKREGTQTLLGSLAGKAELEALADRYAASGRRLRPGGTSLVAGRLTRRQTRFGFWRVLTRSESYGEFGDRGRPPGIWGGLANVYAEAQEQRCWNCRIVNVLDQVQQKDEATAKALLTVIPYSETKEEAERKRRVFREWCAKKVYDGRAGAGARLGAEATQPRERFPASTLLGLSVIAQKGRKKSQACSAKGTRGVSVRRSPT